MSTRHTAVVLLLLSSVLLRSLASGTPAIQSDEWSGPINVFSGATTNVTVGVRSAEAFDGRATWRLSANSRTLSRGESALTVAAGDMQDLSISLSVPEVKPGVVFQATLSLLLLDGDEAVGQVEKSVYVFAEDVFEGKRDWLAKLPLHLFDPAGVTAEILDDAKVSYKQITNIDALPAINDGCLLVGESVSFREYRGLWEAMAAVAAKGVPVLCLAPAEGEVDLTATWASQSGRRAAGLDLRDRDVIRALDKRLAVGDCIESGDEEAKCLNLRGDRGPVLLEVIPGEAGWQWAEITFRPKDARLVVCTFPIVGNWQQSPTPRYLFLRMLEHVTDGKAAGKPRSGTETEEGGRR